MGHDLEKLLESNLRNPHSTFSVGSFGAIAEFHRAQSEEATIESRVPYSAVTTRGAIRIETIDDLLPIAYENLSNEKHKWRNGIVFCLPSGIARSNQRSVLTELGPDWSAVRTKDRGATLFDVGLNTINIDFCIRTENEKFLDILRRAEGRSVLESDNPVVGEIIAASPHRIAISKLGRIEVYQRIPTDQTLEGPHTHVLPKLLRTGRTHSANVPVPEGYLPCLSCYPPNPLYDSMGNETPFNNKNFQDFMAILEKWGLPEYLDVKKRVLEAIRGSIDPEDFEQPTTRLGRTALRVTLRQLICQNKSSSLLEEWRRTFDTVDKDGID